MLWKIHYSDGSTFSNQDGAPEDAPAWGVEFILQMDDPSPPDSTGRLVESGKDYYIRRGDRWIGVDLVGLVDQLAASGLIKVGRTVTADEWRGLYRRALADPDFPPKSAWLPTEMRHG